MLQEKFHSYAIMNGPKQTACLTKGYTYSYAANIMAIVRGSVPHLWQQTRRNTEHRTWTDNYQILCLASTFATNFARQLVLAPRTSRMVSEVTRGLEAAARLQF